MRRGLLLIGLGLAAFATSAFAARTQDAVVYDPITGTVVMVIYPADDAQLADPAFNPPGMVQQRVPDVPKADPIAEAQVLAPTAGILNPDTPKPVQAQPDAPVDVGGGVILDPGPAP